MRRISIVSFIVVASVACSAGPDTGTGGRAGSGSGGSDGSGGSTVGGSGGQGGGPAGSGGATAGGTGGASGRDGGVSGAGGASGSGGTGAGGASAGAAGAGGAAGVGGIGGGGNAGSGTGGASGSGGTTGGKGGASGAAPDAGHPSDAWIDAPRGDVLGDACGGSGAPNVELGTPSDADPSDDVIVEHTYFALSYSPTKYDPNWVSWHLSASDIGSAARQDNFSPDPLLPAMYYRVKTADYTGSGYDRGHMSPSADNTASVMQNSESFLMTNMLPQYHELNAGPWAGLETFERNLALTDRKEVYIIAGGIFDPTPPKIGPGIAVPKSCFKIIVALEAGQGPCDISLTTPIYAVIMPNETTTTGTPWNTYTTSIDAIEAATGYDFLSNVPLNVQSAIESRVTKGP